jgi:hypothetical protein
MASSQGRLFDEDSAKLLMRRRFGVMARLLSCVPLCSARRCQADVVTFRESTDGYFRFTRVSVS